MIWQPSSVITNIFSTLADEEAR